MEDKMFCFQCQETALNKGCTKVGVCGKDSATSNLQDLLIYVTKGFSEVLQNFRKEGNVPCEKCEDQISFNLFITITNANFDDSKILENIVKTINLKDHGLSKIKNKQLLSECALYNEKDVEKLKEFSNKVGILETKDEDIRSLKELITYGIKGMAAYNKHAHALGKRNKEIDTFIQDALVYIENKEVTLENLIEFTIKTGEYGVKVMALLDEANTSYYGNPKITEVNIGVGKRPGILVSGHDLKDLEELLEQSKDSGIDIYSHSEMLPAHYYPFFKKYSHFVGNYGNAWWKQKEEFESFNGPILLTTNCLVPPKASYIDRIYTTGAVGFEGCKHIEGEIGNKKDFTQIIEHAKKCNSPQEIETGNIVGGFAHNQVIQLADKVIEAVKNGDIKKFVVMAGCDGRSNSRNYYTDFAKELPKDGVILTAGCAKYKYNKLNLGDINGIPRVLDAGQCNDSYSLAIIALKLKEVFELDNINDLPIIYNIAWYEQKAVIVLLALLYLGVKDIHLGPTLPAFLSPNVVKFLVDNFGIAPIKTVNEDIKSFFPNIEAKKIYSKDMLISEIIYSNKQAANVLSSFGMGCLGCPASQAESISDACLVHGLDVEEVLNELNRMEK